MLSLYFRFDENQNKWILRSKKYPDLIAISDSLPSSLALGMNIWHIVNDSKVSSVALFNRQFLVTKI